MKRCAFTLLELLVVVSIIAVLFGLLLGAIQKIRESSNRVTCQNNAKQVLLGLHNYSNSNSCLPAGIKDPFGKSSWPAAGWQIFILPFIEQEAIYQEAMAEYKRTKCFYDVSINSYPHTAMAHPIKNFLCQSDPRIQNRYLSRSLGYFVNFTSYVGNCGEDCKKKNGLLFLDSKIAITEVLDGTSNTFVIGERPPNANLELGWWYAGLGYDGRGSGEMILGAKEQFTGEIPLTGPCPLRVYEFSSGRFSEQCDAFHFWSPHSNGAHFGFLDGSIRFLRYEAKPILPALATRSGGETGLNFD